MGNSYEVKFSYLRLATDLTPQGVKYRRLRNSLENVEVLSPQAGVLIQTNFGFECFMGIRQLITFWIPTFCCDSFELFPKLKNADFYTATHYSEFQCANCATQLTRHFLSTWQPPISNLYSLDHMLDVALGCHDVDVFELILIRPALEKKINRIAQSKILLEQNYTKANKNFTSMLARESGRLEFF